MKKIILFLFLIIQCSAYAINWETITTPAGKTAYLDKDSILQYKSYYFYNIKVFNDSINDFSVVTIQSSMSKPFSARINFYTPDEYERLQGDYLNITKNITKSLEPVTYKSTVNSCYKRVKEITSGNALQIGF